MEQTKKQTMYEKILVEELRNCARLRREWRGNSVYDENKLLNFWRLYVHFRTNKDKHQYLRMMFTACYSCLLRSGWHKDSSNLMESFGVLQCKNTDCPYYKPYKEMHDYIYANLDTNRLVEDLKEIYNTPEKHLSGSYGEVDDPHFLDELEKFAREQGEKHRMLVWRKVKQLCVWEDYVQNTGNAKYLSRFRKCYNCTKVWSPELTFGIIQCEDTACKHYKEYREMYNHIYANLDIDTLLLGLSVFRLLQGGYSDDDIFEEIWRIREK
ncbi:MAG: hypothetical protein KKA79_09770 [Nanoarchaeota archaeon]|nr:hypothetical protein [Nanoarchaeota archaeon]